MAGDCSDLGHLEHAVTFIACQCWWDVNIAIGYLRQKRLLQGLPQIPMGLP